MKVKISYKYRKTIELYKYFARDYQSSADFSEEMAQEMYVYESQGKGSLSAENGYVYGKRNMDIAVSSWIEDIEKGNLFVHELYEDENLPSWFLDKVLVKYSHRPKSQQGWDDKIAEYRKSLMLNYQDRWSRFHHKLCIDGEPSSGNGFLYSAYAAKLGISLDQQKLEECFQYCMVYYEAKDAYILNRNPGKSTSPISRDEILGMVSLGLIDGKAPFLTPQNWNFCPFIQPKFSLLQLVKQLWQLRPHLVRHPLFSPPDMVPYFKVPRIFTKLSGYYYLTFKHRNYFWQNELSQLYRFAFSTPIQDRHFILKCWRKFQWWRPSHLFYGLVAFIDSKLLGRSGIRWLKYGGLGNEIAMTEEFPEDHPIRVKFREKHV